MINFSVVVPLYNKGNCVLHTLSSVLRQSYNNYEVIVIDDGSTDDGFSIVEKWINSLPEHDSCKFNLINQENSGVSEARNRGVREARYDYIAFLDSDDLWEIDHLIELAKLVKKFSDRVDFFSTYCIQQSGVKVYPKLGKYSNYFGVVDFFRVSLISNGFVHSSSCCVKRELALARPFPVGMKNFEDSSTWARWADKKGLAFSSIASAIYVIDNASASANIEWDNFLRFSNILFDSCRVSKLKLNFYILRFFILHCLYFRAGVSNSVYFKVSYSYFLKDFYLSLAILFAAIIPRSILSLARNTRKY